MYVCPFLDTFDIHLSRLPRSESNTSRENRERHDNITMLLMMMTTMMALKRIAVCMPRCNQLPFFNTADIYILLCSLFRLKLVFLPLGFDVYCLYHQSALVAFAFVIINDYWILERTSRRADKRAAKQEKREKGQLSEFVNPLCMLMLSPNQSTGKAIYEKLPLRLCGIG